MIAARTARRRRQPEYGEKFDQALAELRARLKRGDFQAGVRLPAEAELHRDLGVGRQTLLRVLDVLVKEGLIVRRRGSGTYVSEQSSPPLLPGRHLRFGLLWHNSVERERWKQSFVGSMTTGALAQWGLPPEPVRFPEVGERETTRAIWSSPRRGVTVEAIGEPMAVVHRRPSLAAVREGRYDGVLALGIIEEPWLAGLLELQLPTVIVDYPGDAFAGRTDLVFVDSQPGYRRAVAYLAAQGARRIHFAGDLVVATPRPDGLSPEQLPEWRKEHWRQDPDSLLRQHAWQLAMAQHGLPVEPGWVHLAGNARRHWEPIAAKLAHLPPGERPEAMVCSSVEPARCFQEFFSVRGLPLRVAGAMNGACEGPWLPIHISGAHVGATAASMLLARILQPSSPFLRVGVAMDFQPQAAGAAVVAASPAFGS